MENLASTEPGFLEPETNMEKTYRVSQEEIMEAVDLQSKKKVTMNSIFALAAGARLQTQISQKNISSQ